MIYWEQSKQFFDALTALPDLAAPLTTYYCLLNATKALLSAKGQVFAESHGVGGRAEPGRKSLANEIVGFQGAGADEGQLAGASHAGELGAAELADGAGVR
jgi:hypothetical protein